MVTSVEHRRALQELLQFDRPLADLRNAVLAAPYDYDGEPVLLRKEHIAHALNCFVDGIITAGDLEVWAELIEGRPGIDFETSAEDELSEILFQISTPEINGPVSIEKCQRMLEQLSS